MKKALVLFALALSASSSQAEVFETETHLFAGEMSTLVAVVETRLAQAIAEKCPSGQATVSDLVVGLSGAGDAGPNPLLAQVEKIGDRSGLYFPTHPVVKLSANITCATNQP